MTPRASGKTRLQTMGMNAFKPVTDLHDETPRPKLIEKYAKTAAGFLVFVGGFFTPKYLGLHVTASYVISGFGAFMMSQELVVRYLKIIPSAIKALTGKVPSDPPEGTGG